MKTFNKSIKIEISVDALAQQLLGTIDENFKHRDMLAEAIIGSALTQNTLHFIYNSLNGFGNEINFEVGEQVICTDTIYTYNPDPENTSNWIGKYEPMGSVRILEIDLYRSEKLRVEHEHTNSAGKQTLKEAWVNHEKCEKWAPIVFQQGDQVTILHTGETGYIVDVCPADHGAFMRVNGAGSAMEDRTWVSFDEIIHTPKLEAAAPERARRAVKSAMTNLD